MNEPSLSSRERAVCLLEAYEGLLTEKQRDIMDDYYRYDLSLSEIAENRSISRAGAYDAIQKSLEKLEEYEAKLDLIKKKTDICAKIEEIESKNNDEEKLRLYRNLGKELTHGI